MPDTRLLILGSNSGLGRALQRHLAPRFKTTAWTRADLDLEQPETIAEKLSRHDFDVLLNPAGLTSPDVCEAQPAKAQLVNTHAPQALAEVCHARGARMIHFSTDYVFGGERQPWGEDDETTPINVYGRTKRAGELSVLRASPDALVARVSWLFGPDKASHPDQMIERALQSAEITAVEDKFSAPTSTADVCEWAAHFMAHPHAGVLHWCNSGVASWHSWGEAALEIVARMGVPVQTTKVKPIQLAELTQLQARRPRLTQMNNERLQRWLGREVRHWHAALEEYLRRKYSNP